MNVYRGGLDSPSPNPRIELLRSLLKTLRKNYHLLTCTSEIHFKRYYNTTFYYLKDLATKNRDPLHVTQNFKKESLFDCCFHEAFVKNFMKNLSFFNTYFQNLFQHALY